MSRRSRGPYLYLDKKRDSWIIRDRAGFTRTGCAGSEVDQANLALASYITSKYEPKASRAPLISEVLAAYTADKSPSRNTAYNIKALLPWWTGKRASDATPKNCRAYAATRTPAAAGAHLKVLQSALRHWHDEYGPLPAKPKVWRPKSGPPKDRWLTRQEAARLLRAARRTTYLARLILLGLYTGSRPGVVRSLEWAWIDFSSGVMRRRAAAESERGNKRRPPVKLGRRILAHLKRWKRLDGGHCRLIVHYNGKFIDDPHGSWKRAIRVAKLPGVTPHTLRHTRATWLMQAGIDPWEAAGALGMSVRVLEAVYGHHHPNFQGRAAEV